MLTSPSELAESRVLEDAGCQWSFWDRISLDIFQEA